MAPSSDVQDIVTTDVLVIGSSPSATTYARKLADGGIDVLLLDLAPELPPAAAKVSISSTKTTMAPPEKRLAPLVEPSPSALHESTDAELDSLGAWILTKVGSNIEHDTTNIIGCIPRPHYKLEQSDLFTDTEWRTLYTEAEERLRVHSDLFENSIRHQLVKRTLQDQKYDGGSKDFFSMPLAAQKSSDQTAEWANSTIVLGGLAEKNNHFKSREGCICVKLVGNGGSGGRPDAIRGAICKALGDNKKFEVQAKKYVLAAESIDNARLLLGSGWTLDDLPALGRYLFQPVVATCKVALSAELMKQIPSDPFRLGWKRIVENHHSSDPDDAISIPKDDPLPQVYSPVSEAYPWHAQLCRDPNSEPPAGVDQRLVIDLRWVMSTIPDIKNNVSFDREVHDQYGRAHPTLSFQVASDDEERSQRMMEDMTEVAAKLGAYIPGCYPEFEQAVLHASGSRTTSGTTRAGRDSSTSVCDRYGKIWACENVYVGGPSILPTATAASNTLVAMCFAAAGADQMISELSTKP